MDFDVMSTPLEWMGIIAGVVGLWTAALAWAQERITAELLRRGFRPLVVGWRAFAYVPAFGPTFRVLYTNSAGLVHSADCSLRNWQGPVLIRKIRLIGQPESVAAELFNAWEARERHAFRIRLSDDANPLVSRAARIGEAR